MSHSLPLPITQALLAISTDLGEPGPEIVTLNSSDVFVPFFK